jgi:ABC-type antimicrobial peptide transport system permease subunit
LGPQVGDDSIVNNQWLAEDLGAAVGDDVELTYFVSGSGRQLQEKTTRLRVSRIIPIEGLAADPNLMPEFPGLAGAKNCHDWDPGIAIDLDRIRPKDEEYWDRYGGTPKAFVTLAAGRVLWSNRFGDLTAVRWPLQGNSESGLSAAILAKMDPGAIGLSFHPVREQGQKAATQGTDFGPLFLGLSMFLIGAAVVLIGLLFVFSVEARASQIGTLLALGLDRARVNRLLLWEGGAVAAIGALVGTLLGLGYTRVLIAGLSSIWQGAVAGEPILFYVRPASLVTGAGIGLVTALAVMAWTLRRQVRHTAHQLLAGTAQDPSTKGPSMRRMELGLGISGLALGGAILLVLVSGIGSSANVAAGFFGAGTLLLIGCLVWAGTVIRIIGFLGQGMGLTRARLAIRNAARRPGRSQAVIAMLACGVFMVIAVGANRKAIEADPADRRSGTGGFSLYAQTTVPVLQDLNTPGGRKAMGLDDATLAGTGIVQIRVSAGDDASCLNLNRAQRPSLLGVDPNRLKDRFSFRESPIPDAWFLLEKDLGPDLVPAIGDYATVIWGLGKSIGDRIEYTDEKGRRFSVQIVGVLENSIFQGNLLIPERAFVNRFPSRAGYGLFLVDAPAERASMVSAYLTSRIEDLGMTVDSTTDRLAAFTQVEATYLAVFLALGGLGLVLGTVGLALVVLRNLLERRGEWAMMRAVGFDRGTLARMAFGEHWGLLVAGLIFGTGSAIIAIGPAIKSGSGQLPVGELAVTLAAIAVSGAVWVALASALVLRGPIWDALRNE